MRIAWTSQSIVTELVATMPQSNRHFHYRAFSFGILQQLRIHPVSNNSNVNEGYINLCIRVHDNSIHECGCALCSESRATCELELLL